MNDDRARKTALWLMAGLFVFRALYLFPFTAQFDLVGDEAYYWDWGRRPDWGYYSKPPMIGWLMGLIGWLSSDSEWAVRFAALCFSTTSLAVLHRLTQKLFDSTTALVALLFAALTPANIGLSLLFTIDAPLVLAWCSALLLFWSAYEKPQSTLRWLALMLVLGLGHMSKQMMLIFPLIMVLFALFSAEARPLLRNARFWMCSLGSLLFMVPMILWNQQHQWITIKHMEEHVRPSHSQGLIEHVAEFFTFPGLQAGVFTPLTWLLITVASLGGLWKWRRLNNKERFLVIFSAPALVAFFGLALRQSVNPNWPAVFYLSATILAAAWVRGQALAALTLPRLQALGKPAIKLAIVFCVLTYALPLITTALGLEGNPKIDLAARLRGWSEMGKEAGKYLEAAPRPTETFVLALGHREHASQLAFDMPQHPRVYRWDLEGRVESQYELWPSAEERLGWDALIFDPETDRPLMQTLDHAFESTEKLGEIHVPIGYGRGRDYQVYLGHKLKSWPKPKPRTGLPSEEKKDPDAETIKE